MFADEETGKGLRELMDGIKRYLKLQKDYARLELVEKLSILLSAILLIFVMIILGMVAFFYLLFTVAYWIAPHVGGAACSFGIITFIALACITIVYMLRDRMIKKPIVRFMAKLFLSTPTNKQ